MPSPQTLPKTVQHPDVRPGDRLATLRTEHHARRPARAGLRRGQVLRVRELGGQGVRHVRGKLRREQCRRQQAAALTGSKKGNIRARPRLQRAHSADHTG
ncbi:uncharacterized protein A1O9_01004 [Exophiala aquamarina CBS 119918]|uniref:Uncharacterized protein n=1 Tax=Exophiala aquamarina CBS 119918 TaxID=1182545 RepID=A0A072PUJ7_9EURO|nr:uncharacterized protein A1O9_01004 [Exophiala aquamarina CBS 119918]KEF63028.1 hypothetical protein A1O9_01004 [Exophiala aquamarina CBS 119918]